MNEYRLLNPHPPSCRLIFQRKNLSVMMIKFFPFSAWCMHHVKCYNKLITWNWCLEVTGGSFGGKDYQSSNNVTVPRTTTSTAKTHEQQLHHMELVPHHHDLPPEFWVNHHENSSLEVLQEAAPTGRIGSLLLPDQLDDNCTDDEEVGDDQDWIENLESTLEVDDEEQQPLQQIAINSSTI
ncbi:hypothetical protein Syun_019620 [Stephania yunnanensis]|uniref:Uncharacterized protein n=1 Tax=Stephania yunnanensis TaxID=152371 RepID=A0AAP0NWU7_9MAGN